MTTTVRLRKGYGFTDDDGNLYLKRCFECGKENYAVAVATGQCAWCNHDGSKELAEFQAKQGTKKANE